MDNGLVFIVVIILFSLLEGVLRKQKAAQALLRGETTEDGPHAPTYEAQASYDDEASYDDQPSYGDQPSYDDQIDDDVPEYSPRSTAVSRSTPAPPSPLIPKDLWQEIAGLMSGVQPSAPDPPPDLSKESTALERPASYQPIPKEEHIVHRAHVGYGTDPSSRAPSEQDGLDPLAERLNADAGAVHQLFGSGDPHALRRAIILQEVLGRPAAFRGDPYEP